MAQKKPQMPDLSKFVNNRVKVLASHMQSVTGTLVGYDPYMNLILHDAEVSIEVRGATISEPAGKIVMRGATVQSVSAL